MESVFSTICIVGGLFLFIATEIFICCRGKHHRLDVREIFQKATFDLSTDEFTGLLSIENPANYGGAILHDILGLPILLEKKTLFLGLKIITPSNPDYIGDRVNVKHGTNDSSYHKNCKPIV